MDKKEIVKGTVSKLRLDKLYNKLLKEKNPKESIQSFRDFLSEQEIEIKNKQEIQEVLASLKLKELFNTLFEYPNMEPEWQSFKKEIGLAGFVFRI